LPIDTLGSQKKDCDRREDLPGSEDLKKRGCGMKFNPNGYNKVYDSNNKLWMDGEFKKSKLQKGKLYKYDENGKLIKIEYWEKGQYHSDFIDPKMPIKT
jgi:antitoxin component YwqK of YwqJK toxin-antitoxin module